MFLLILFKEFSKTSNSLFVDVHTVFYLLYIILLIMNMTKMNPLLFIKFILTAKIILI